MKKSYSHGTYRAGPMRQISLVGAVDEEVGNYFPEFLGMLEETPFLKVGHESNKSNVLNSISSIRNINISCSIINISKFVEGESEQQISWRIAEWILY